MGRRAHIWRRGSRGYYCTHQGRQVFLGHDYQAAEKEFARLKLTGPRRRILRVEVLIDLYLDAFRSEIAESTWQRYRSVLSSFARAHRKVPANELRPYHVDAWLSANDWSKTTKAVNVGVVKAWSGWVEEKGYLDADPLRRARGGRVERRNPANPAHLVAMLNGITDPYFLAYYTVLYDTGCRPSELESLEWPRIAWDTSVAEVRGKTGPRIIGLTERALGILRQGSRVGAVLHRADGQPWCASHRKKAFDYWTHALELPHIIPYHCRHDLARRWSEAGIDGLLIARQLGHSRHGIPHTDLLVSTYYHPSAGALADAAKRASVPPQAPRLARLPGASSKRQRRHG